MMHLKTLLLGFTLSLLPIVSMAGSGHDHGHGHGHDHGHASAPVTQEAAKDNAAQIVSELVTRAKLESSWLLITAASIEKITVKGTPEWLVVFVNSNVADADKQKLYVFLTLSGEYIAANFTGK